MTTDETKIVSTEGRDVTESNSNEFTIPMSGGEKEVQQQQQQQQSRAVATQVSINRTSSSFNFSTKSSKLMNDARSVPIVKVELQELTHQPFTSTATAKAGHSKVKERTVVLDKVSTKISPYQLTAWIGPSGSGKTSLTSVIAGLVRPSDIDGAMIVNGEEGRLPKQLVGVVWQDDLLLSNLTVEETIYFAARLKIPHETPDEEVRNLVEDVMDILGLTHIRDNLIGSALSNQPGISGGERKRTAVAAELVVRPSLLLLDEPTSGLDATTAYSLMCTLKELASLGHSIAVVIHQPRTDIFKLLDHLLLLSKGKVVYDGPASLARSYLEMIPSVGELPPETGIADWIMDSIILDQAQKDGAVLAKHWREYGSKFLMSSSSDSSTTTGGTNRDNRNSKVLVREMSSLSQLKDTPKKFEAPFSQQLRLLASRTLKQRRGEKFTRVSILLTFAYVFFTSYFWWQLPNTTSWIFERNSLLFFMLIAQGNSIVVGSISVFQRDRALLRRERAKKLYGVLPFFLAKTASDMTNNILLPMCYGIIVYFTAGLRLEVTAFFKFVLAYYLTLSCAQSMGFFMSILIPNMQIALLLAPSITLFFFIIGGFYIPLSNMHWGIKWASYVSFCRYGYGALMVTEFADRMIPCSNEDTAISIGGSDECPLPGDVVYESVGIDGPFANYFFNIFICALLNIFFLIGAYVMLRRSK